MIARLSATGGAESPFTTMRAEEIFRQFFGGDFGGFSSMFGGGFGTDSQQVRLRHSVLPYPPSLVPPLLPPSLPLSLPLPTSSPPAQLVLNLTFMEAVKGCTKQVPLRVQATCERCLGSGGEPGTKEQTCPYCRGRGEVRDGTEEGEQG